MFAHFLLRSLYVLGSLSLVGMRRGGYAVAGNHVRESCHVYDDRLAIYERASMLKDVDSCTNKLRIIVQIGDHQLLRIFSLCRSGFPTVWIPDPWTLTPARIVHVPNPPTSPGLEVCSCTYPYTYSATMAIWLIESRCCSLVQSFQENDM
jgi:hypothetical protein